MATSLRTFGNDGIFDPACWWRGSMPLMPTPFNSIYNLHSGNVAPSIPSPAKTSELCTQINRPSPIFCGCDNKLAGTVPIVWIITHRWKFHKEPTRRHIIVTAKSTQRYQDHSWVKTFDTGTGVRLLYEKINENKKALDTFRFVCFKNKVEGFCSRGPMHCTECLPWPQAPHEDEH